jgi:hypothetical protein
VRNFSIVQSHDSINLALDAQLFAWPALAFADARTRIANIFGADVRIHISASGDATEQLFDAFDALIFGRCFSLVLSAAWQTAVDESYRSWY